LSVCYSTLGSDFQNCIDFLWRKSAEKLKGWSPGGKKPTQQFHWESNDIARRKSSNPKPKTQVRVVDIILLFFFTKQYNQSSSPSPESKENHATIATAIIHDQKKKTYKKTKNRRIQKQTRVKKNN
jgi:hypothetical protein